MTAAATLDRVFEALANPARREIITALSQGSSTTPNLAIKFDISKQAFSKHLQVLESAGLVLRRRQGRTDEIQLVAEPLQELTTWAGVIADGWRQNLDRLDDVLERRADGSGDGQRP